jgi:NDP-sugar pyrophosphorylase family protein
MKAVLLGAGKGTRLAPLTDSIPKILAPLGNRPLLDHQLDYLAANGVSEVAVNVHHHADQLLAALERHTPPPATRASYEPELLGTAGALLPLRDFLTEPFLVVYGDVVTDADLGALMARHRELDGIATLAYYRSDDTAGKGLLELAPDGRVTAFVEKPSDARTGCVNAGLYALDPAILDLVGPAPSDFGHDVWPRALAAGHRLYGHELSAYLRDVGSPDALAAADAELVEGARW